MVLDESPHFTGPTLPILIREGRKMGLSCLAISSQYISAWNDSLKDAVLGNLSSLIAFQASADDARSLSGLIKPFTPDDVEGLNPHEAIVRLTAGGVTHRAFDLATLPISEPADQEAFDYVVANTRRLFAKEKSEVDKLFVNDEGVPEGYWESEDIYEE